MAEYHFTTEEYETHLFRDVITKEWVAETNIAQDYRKMKKQGWEVLQEEFYEDGTFKWAKFKARYEAVSFKPAEKKQLSEEQRQQLVERLARARQKV